MLCLRERPLHLVRCTRAIELNIGDLLGVVPRCATTAIVTMSNSSATHQ